MKKIYFLAVTVFSITAFSQQAYSNGGLSTGATASNTAATPAPMGYTWSELQKVGTVTSSTFGMGAIYNTAGTSNLTIADDFVVPTNESWTLTSIDVFMYQTSYVGTTPPIDALRMRIHNGVPGVGSVVAGNLTTNNYNVSGSSDALMYRISNATTGTTRKIWKAKGNLATSLTPGTYWLEFQCHATNDGSIFFPQITPVGVNVNPAWNAKQSTSGSWTALSDAGTSSGIDMPFIINYTATNLGVTEVRQFDNRIQIYPNPVAESFKLNLPNDLKITHLELIDASGRLVKKIKVSDQYDVSDLDKGVYLVKIFGNNTIKTLQFIKK